MTSSSLMPAVDQLLGLAQDVGGRARHEVAAQVRDDAEGAAVVAALGNLQIGVVARRQLDALRRHQIENGSCGGGSRACTAPTTLSYCCGPVTASTSGIALADQLGLRAHAAGDDDPAVLGHRLADRVEASSLALSRKPQVLTSTTSAPA